MCGLAVATRPHWNESNRTCDAIGGEQNNLRNRSYGAGFSYARVGERPAKRETAHDTDAVWVGTVTVRGPEGAGAPEAQGKREASERGRGRAATARSRNPQQGGASPHSPKPRPPQAFMRSR